MRSVDPLDTCKRLLFPLTVPKVAFLLFATVQVASVGSMENDITWLVPCVIEAQLAKRNNGIESKKVLFII